MKTIKPAATQLFCKPLEAETKTSSGLLLSSQAVEKPKIAEVVNVGTSVKGFKQHDNIIYKAYSTTDIKLDNQDFFLVAEEDVLGTVLDV